MSAEIKKQVEGQISIFRCMPMAEWDVMLPNPFKNIETLLRNVEQDIETEKETAESEYRLQIVKKSIVKVNLAKDQIDLTRRTCIENGDNMEEFIKGACDARAIVTTFSTEKKEKFLKIDILEKPMGDYVVGCNLKNSYESVCEQFLRQAEIIKDKETLASYRSNFDQLPYIIDYLKRPGVVAGTDNIVNINDKKNGANYSLMFGVRPRLILSVNTKKICD